MKITIVMKRVRENVPILSMIATFAGIILPLIVITVQHLPIRLVVHED